jgi:hypothetical protein
MKMKKSMQTKSFGILAVLLGVSLWDSAYLRISRPKPAAEFTVVDHETGDPLQYRVGSTTSRSFSAGNKSRITSGPLAVRIESDSENGRGRVTWLAKDSIPVEFTLGAEGYETVPLPRQAIDEVRAFTAVGGISGSRYTVRLKKNSATSPESVPGEKPRSGNSSLKDLEVL